MPIVETITAQSKGIFIPNEAKKQRSRQKYDAYDDQKYDSQKSVKNTIPKIPQKYENNLPIKFIYTN